MIPFISISIFAAIGAVLRAVITDLKVFERFKLPCGTFTVNVIGAFLMGLTVTLIAQESIYYFPMVFGFLGGFTTYSAFALDQLKLLEEKDYKNLIKHSLMTLFFCLAALAAGLLTGVYAA